MRRSRSFGAALIDAESGDDLAQLFSHLRHIVTQIHYLGSYGAVVGFQCIHALRLTVGTVRVRLFALGFLFGAHLLGGGHEGVAPLSEGGGHEPELLQFLGPAFDLGGHHAPLYVGHLIADVRDLRRDVLQPHRGDLGSRETGELLGLLAVHNLECPGVVDGRVHAAGDVRDIHAGSDERLLDLPSARIHDRYLLLHVGHVLGLLASLCRIRRHHDLQCLHGGGQSLDLVVYEPQLSLVLAGRHRMDPL